MSNLSKQNIVHRDLLKTLSVKMRFSVETSAVNFYLTERRRREEALCVDNFITDM